MQNKKYMILVENIFHRIRIRDTSSSKGTKDVGFRNNSITNVSVQQGDNAFIHCTVYQPEEKTVSKDIYLRRKFKVTPSHQETTKKGYFPKKSFYCIN